MTTKDVDQLVYNFQNPQAARDNAVQAAADVFAVARAVGTFSAGGLKLDAAKVALYGTQGGNAAANAIGLEPGMARWCCRGPAARWCGACCRRCSR